MSDSDSDAPDLHLDDDDVPPDDDDYIPPLPTSAPPSNTQVPYSPRTVERMEAAAEVQEAAAAEAVAARASASKRDLPGSQPPLPTAESWKPTAGDTVKLAVTHIASGPLTGDATGTVVGVTGVGNAMMVTVMRDGKVFKYSKHVLQKVTPTHRRRGSVSSIESDTPEPTLSAVPLAAQLRTDVSSGSDNDRRQSSGSDGSAGSYRSSSFGSTGNVVRPNMPGSPVHARVAAFEGETVVHRAKRRSSMADAAAKLMARMAAEQKMKEERDPKRKMQLRHNAFLQEKIEKLESAVSSSTENSPDSVRKPPPKVDAKATPAILSPAEVDPFIAKQPSMTNAIHTLKLKTHRTSQETALSSIKGQSPAPPIPRASTFSHGSRPSRTSTSSSSSIQQAPKESATSPKMSPHRSARVSDSGPNSERTTPTPTNTRTFTLPPPRTSHGASPAGSAASSQNTSPSLSAKVTKQPQSDDDTDRAAIAAQKAELTALVTQAKELKAEQERVLADAKRRNSARQAEIESAPRSQTVNREALDEARAAARRDVQRDADAQVAEIRAKHAAELSSVRESAAAEAAAAAEAKLAAREAELTRERTETLRRQKQQADQERMALEQEYADAVADAERRANELEAKLQSRNQSTSSDGPDAELEELRQEVAASRVNLRKERRKVEQLKAEQDEELARISEEARRAVEAEAAKVEAEKEKLAAAQAENERLQAKVAVVSKPTAPDTNAAEVARLAAENAALKARQDEALAKAREDAVAAARQESRALLAAQQQEVLRLQAEAQAVKTHQASRSPSSLRSGRSNDGGYDVYRKKTAEMRERKEREKQEMIRQNEEAYRAKLASEASEANKRRREREVRVAQMSKEKRRQLEESAAAIAAAVKRRQTNCNSRTLQFETIMSHLEAASSGDVQGYHELGYREGHNYKGDWNAAGQRHGYGVLTLADGTRYGGQIIDGECLGVGVMVFPDQSRYEGDFERNIPHGFGVLTQPNGTKFEGMFAHGEPRGYGLVTLTDGTNGLPRLEGDFEDGLCVRRCDTSAVVREAQGAASQARVAAQADN